VGANRPTSTHARPPLTLPSGNIASPRQVQIDLPLEQNNTAPAPLIIPSSVTTAHIDPDVACQEHSPTLPLSTSAEGYPWYKIRHHPKAFAASMAILGIFLTAIFSEPSYRSAALAKVGNAYTKIGNWMAKQDHELNVYDWCEAHPLVLEPGDTFTSDLTSHRSSSIAQNVQRSRHPCVSVWARARS
jgi:hypothetical protein